MTISLIVLRDLKASISKQVKLNMFCNYALYLPISPLIFHLFTNISFLIHKL